MRKRKNNAQANSLKPPADTQKRPWGVILIVIVVDQFTKFGAPLFFPIVKNTGTVFGLFGQNNVVFFVISLAIICGLAYWITQVANRDTSGRMKWIQFASYLIIGGGISNLIDRFFHGYVVDFITIPIWPTFNIADACITFGVTFLIWQFMFAPKENQTDEQMIAQ